MTGIAEAAAVIAEWLAGTVVAEGSAATVATVAGEVGAGAGATAGAAGASTSLWGTAAQAAAGAAAGAATTSLLAPKPPGAKPVAAMPDPQAVEAARRRSLIEQTSRRGRASTILTSDDTLG